MHKRKEEVLYCNKCAGIPLPLDISARRKINLTVIAYAQELFLHFADRELAMLLKESSIQRMTDASYGSQRDCRSLCKYADDRMKALLADDVFAAFVHLTHCGSHLRVRVAVNGLVDEVHKTGIPLQSGQQRHRFTA